MQTLRFTWCWVWRFLVQLCPHTCTCRHTHECSVTPQLLQLCPHTCTCCHTRVQCYHPLPPALTAVSPHLYTPVHAIVYMCAVLPTPSNCNSCSCAPTPVHAVIHVCSFTPSHPNSYSCVPTPVHAIIHMCTVLPAPANPSSCSCVPTPVHAVIHMCAVLHPLPPTLQLLQLCPHTCICCHTHVCSVTPPSPHPPTPAAVSPHLYMLSYTCVQCYPPPPTATPAAVSPHLYMLSYTCVQCYLPPPPPPTSPIVHALIHTGAMLPSIPPPLIQRCFGGRSTRGCMRNKPGWI